MRDAPSGGSGGSGGGGGSGAANKPTVSHEAYIYAGTLELVFCYY